MSLLKQFHLALQQPDRVADDAQLEAVVLLDQLSTDLSRQKLSIPRALLRLTPFAKPVYTPVKGIYLWGGVGRGKTWLMNMFYNTLPFPEKARVHFHRFMLDIHAKLDELNRTNRRTKNRNSKNPLKKVAGDIAEKYRVLCIDEFIVTNITDAMILSQLLQALFDHGVCIVATSNRIPDDLYLNGLQRDRFLPAIELIKTRMRVFHLDSGVDHRMALMELAGIYYQPIVDGTGEQILQRATELSVTPLVRGQVLDIQHRKIKTVYCSEELAWFDFNEICSEPRAAPDYIDIARQFSTVIVTNIPVMNEQDDQARRFIYLIDELYDHNVKLIASADDSPQNLYRGSMLEFAFNRTRSRLIEMQSHQYLGREHQPDPSMSKP